MITVLVCFLLALAFFLVVKSLRNYCIQKNYTKLDLEISHDLDEEFDIDSNPNEFLNWLEEIQFEDDMTLKKNPKQIGQ
jgi:cell division protein FtsL